MVLFTHHSDPEMVTLDIQSGAIDYIPKDALAEVALLETMRQMGLIEPCTIET